MPIERAPVHQRKRHSCTCRNCGQAFQASCKKSIWCEADLCQAAKLRYYKLRVKAKREATGS